MPLQLPRKLPKLLQNLSISLILHIQQNIYGLGQVLEPLQIENFEFQRYENFSRNLGEIITRNKKMLNRT